MYNAGDEDDIIGRRGPSPPPDEQGAGIPPEHFAAGAAAPGAAAAIDTDGGADGVPAGQQGPAAPTGLKDDARAARDSASGDECRRVHSRLRDALPNDTKLRFAQARHLAAVQDGSDAVLIAATGSGKSLTMFLQARADVIDAECEGNGGCRPVDLVIIPMANMGPCHEEAFNTFVTGLQLQGRPVGALYVDRGNYQGGAAAAPSAQKSRLTHCPEGHTLNLCRIRAKQGRLEPVRCDAVAVPQCPRDIGVDELRWRCGAGCDYDVCSTCHSSLLAPTAGPASDRAQTHSLPSALPCGLCDMCVRPSAQNANKRQKLAHGCNFSCRVIYSAPEDKASRWCSMCNNRAAVSKCKLRQRIMASSAADGAGGQQQGGGHQGGRGADRDAVEGGAASTPPQRLEDLHPSRDEARIAFDATVLLVVCTASALHQDSGGGRLLHAALSRRGVRRLHVDELHTLSQHREGASMASYSAALAEIATVIRRLLAGLQCHRHRRPQITGYTCTLPPVCVPHVRAQACMAVSAKIVRCAIDRPELQYVRLPLPPHPGERRLLWGQRVLAHLERCAPHWAQRESVIVFCPTARFARNAAKSFILRRPDGNPRTNYLYLGVRNMSGAKRRAAADGFAASQGGALFTTEAWSHGSGNRGVAMVVHLALPKGPIELAQRSGRAAREADEHALIVFPTSSTMLVQRLVLSPSDDVGSLVGTQNLVEQLAAAGCLRATFLRHLGQRSPGTGCAGCDQCIPRTTSQGRLSLGMLPHLLHWQPAQAAIVALADAWPTDRHPTLTSVINQLKPSDAPPPFDHHNAHDGLIFALLAEKTIRWEAVPLAGRESHGSYAVCRLDPERVREYRSGQRTVDVLLAAPEPSDDGIDPPSTSEPFVVSSLAQAVDSDLHDAAVLIRRAQRRLNAGMAVHGPSVMCDVALSIEQVRLLSAVL